MRNGFVDGASAAGGILAVVTKSAIVRVGVDETGTRADVSAMRLEQIGLLDKIALKTSCERLPK